MGEPATKTNYFVRTLICLFCILLVVMIGCRYFSGTPKYDISASVITLLLMILVLALAESFDNFSVGKLITISREKKEKEKQVEKLERQNSQLLTQLISISSSQSQTQSHITVSGDYIAQPSVQKATPEEVQEKLTEEPVNQQPATETKPSINWRKVEQIGLNKYLQQRAIHPSNYIAEAKLVSQFQGIDPISNLQPIFDGYIRESGHETFVEFRLMRSIGLMGRDRIYVMLSKIYYYKIVKRIEAHLDLVFLKVPGEEARTPSYINRFLDNFEPAIASGLLKISEIELTEEETAECRQA